jgi:uncharacterized protein YdeI (YjbR/CyaY-like superfamily)
MNAMNPKADFYFEAENNWQDALKRLRKIVLSCGLTEEVKWGTPCYTYGKSNIVLLHVFKEYCAMLFFKGALLNDTHGILVQQTANVQAARQVRFTDAQQVTKLASVLKAYIYEAIEAEKAGLKVSFKKTTAYTVPEEFQGKLDKRPALKKAFEALTPGRQRAYLLFFSSAKQPATRTARVEKYIQHILKGKGLNDE